MSEHISNMIDKIMEKDFAGANESFGDLMAGRVSDALDTEKVVIAAEIYNDVDREEAMAEAAEKHGMEITLDELEEGEYKGDENKKAKQKKMVKGTNVAYEV